MRRGLKTVVLALFVAGSIFALLYAEKTVIDRYRAPSEDIETAVVSIVHGDGHTVTITDKETGTRWTFKPVLRRNGRGKTKVESDNICHICDRSEEIKKPIDTKKEIAKIAGVSHNTIARVEKIEKQATPEIKAQVKSGEISINQAYQATVREEKKAVVKEKATGKKYKVKP